MKNALTLTLASALAFAGAAAEDKILWPADDTVMKAQSDSTLVFAPEARVTTGTQAAWPGMRLDFKAGEVDLSAYGRLLVAVSNTQDRALQVHLSVKGKTVQGRTPGGSVALAPHATGVIDVSLRNMPWRLDAPLELKGMNGAPTALGGSTFDVRKTHSFHIFLNKDGQTGGFSVSRVTACGGGDTPPKVLKAATFLPFVDAYGQFLHDDWPGKIHNDAELAAAKTAEDAWLAAHAEGTIPDRDPYGGWAAGPQLRATGFFRTEKVNGKWWLVDPEGRLFWSHGVDCVRVGNETGVGFRENYFSWMPAKDDPVFGCFRGRATWPGAHGFYKEPAHVPYETFDFARANALRKYGPDWRVFTRVRAHDRIRAWGLNTIANWSDPTIYQLRRTPYTLCLGTGGTPRRAGSKGWWGPLPDPENPKFAETLRARARAAARNMKNDPWCLGVFVDNELSWNDLPDLAHVAEVYFATVAKILHEELPNHLYLGARIAWGTPDVYRACARHCDVVSVNIYARQPIRDLPEGAADKPMINGEFHFGALDRGMFHTGLVATRDQNERAQCYRDYVTACLDHPRFVGTHWFQWQDQALTGRSDGENYQIGFVTGTDTPYPELVQAARDMGATMYSRRYNGK